MATYQPAYQSYQQPSSKPQYLGSKQKSNSGWIKPPPPYAGPPPVPPGMSVNPQQWQAGYWQYNPSWNQNQNSKQQHVPWIPSHHWMPQYNDQSSSSSSQQQASHNPFKRVPRPPSAEYLATRLSDNPLGLSGLDEPNKYYDQMQTPWVWRPCELADDDQESPSQDQAPTDSPSHSRRNSENTNVDERESFTAKRELQPTFSINIVRTPEHYRRQSSGSNPPTPSRNSSRESRNNSADAPPTWNSLMSPTNNGINGASREGGSPDSSTLAVSGPILGGEELSDEPASILSPLIISHTPKSPLRSLRSHVTHPLIGSSLEPIPEATNIQNDSKISPSKPKDRRPAAVTHSSSLPTIPSSQHYGSPQPSPHWEAYDKERDRGDKEKRDRPGIGSKYTTATFIEPRSIASNTHNHHLAPHPSSPASPSSHSTPSSRHSSSSLPSPASHATPPSSYSPRPSPPQRKSKTTPPEDTHYKPQLHTQSSSSSFTKLSKPSDSTTLVIPKIPLPPPPLQGTYPPIRSASVQTYDNRRRRGYWNRRGDHLTNLGYVVRAPPEKVFPHELRNYPTEEEGYENHDGVFTAFVPRPELPENLPKNGKPAELPYEHFVVYEPQ